MNLNNIILKTAFVLSFFFAGSLFAAASCASDAYSKSCQSCKFDENGKMDSACYKGHQSGGTSCISTSYPLAAVQYSKGNCSGIDECASELSACKSQYSSGNDSADCAEGSVATCFAAADQCVAKAAAKCEGAPSCMPAAAIMLIVGAVFLFGFARRQ